jgi:plastin-3
MALALIWQLMRAYTLSVLSQVSGSAAVDKEIVAWVNKKLESVGKTTSIRSFQDSSISNGKVVLDLIDSIKPGSINYELVNDGDEYEVN